MSHTLIVYYSWSNGNTRRIAQQIHEAYGYDMIEIDTLYPYQGSYDDVVKRGQWEVEHHYEPKLCPIHVNMSQYSTIILGTPTWWYTMAPAMLTFLKSYDWTGKTMIPFQTHGGWVGHVIDDIKDVCKGAQFKKEKAIQFDSQGGDLLMSSEEEMKEWIDQLNLIEEEQ